MLGLGTILPDLSRYSDEEYEKLVWQAKGRRGDALWVIPGLVGFAAAGVWGAIAALMQVGIAKSGGGVNAHSLSWFAIINVVVALAIGVAVGGVVRWVLIVRSIRRIINKAGCPYCEFSLVGLRIKNGWVRCPECGQRIALHEHRLTEDDIVPPGGWYRPIEGAGPRGAYLSPEVAETRAKPPARAERSTAAPGQSPAPGGRSRAG